MRLLPDFTGIPNGSASELAPATRRHRIREGCCVVVEPVLNGLHDEYRLEQLGREAIEPRSPLLAEYTSLTAPFGCCRAQLGRSAVSDLLPAASGRIADRAGLPSGATTHYALVEAANQASRARCGLNDVTALERIGNVNDLHDATPPAPQESVSSAVGHVNVSLHERRRGFTVALTKPQKLVGSGRFRTIALLGRDGSPFSRPAHGVSHAVPDH
jgi:hypothetical protein